MRNNYDIFLYVHSLNYIYIIVTPYGYYIFYVTDVKIAVTQMGYASSSFGAFSLCT